MRGQSAAAMVLLVLASSCSSGSDDSGGGGGAQGSVLPPAGAGAPPTAGVSGSIGAASAGTMAPAPSDAAAGVGGAGTTAPPVAGAAGTPPTEAGSGGSDPGGTAGTGVMQVPNDGPEDGDPAKPVVSLSDVPCRDGAGGGFGFPSANLKVDDRDVILDYPCNKHEGAPVTFILNLHGTTPVAQHFYQEGYFSAYQFATSHNLIIATPSSVVEQWGNGDNGADEPYLMHVIDYVYSHFGDKFQIKAMWVGGHSWGAFYASTFVCKDYIADKVKGVIIMSGSPNPPACSDRISVIDTNAEMDIGPPLEQGNWPTTHGCDASMMQTLGNNTETFWPNCDPGYVHANYLMLGKMHADFMDKEVVQSIVDWIKLSRQTQP